MRHLFRQLGIFFAELAVWRLVAMLAGLTLGALEPWMPRIIRVADPLLVPHVAAETAHSAVAGMLCMVLLVAFLLLAKLLFRLLRVPDLAD